MKRIKLLFITLLVFAFGIATVYAEGPNPESSLVSVDGITYYEKGVATHIEVDGVSFNEETMTLTVKGETVFANLAGIKIMDMGDDFTLVIDGVVKYSVNERNDGIFIKNTNVTVKSYTDSSLTIDVKDGSGIIVDGTAKLHLGNLTFNVKSVRFNEGAVDTYSRVKITDTKFYQNGNEVDPTTLVVEEVVTPVEEADEKIHFKNTDPSIKRKDSLSDIAGYAIIGGLLVVCAVVVLLLSVKNGKKEEPKAEANEDKKQE